MRRARAFLEEPAARRAGCSSACGRRPAPTSRWDRSCDRSRRATGPAA